MLSSKLKDKVEEFKKEFARAKDSFDRSVKLDILKTIHELGKPNNFSSTQSLTSAQLNNSSCNDCSLLRLSLRLGKAIFA